MVEPYGCAACGIEFGGHGSRFKSDVGLHKWLRPSDEHVKLRMQHRRWRRKESAKWWADFRKKHPRATPDVWLLNAPMPTAERDRITRTVMARRNERMRAK